MYPLIRETNNYKKTENKTERGEQQKSEVETIRLLFRREKKRTNEQKMLHRYEQNKSDCSYFNGLGYTIYSSQYDLYMVLCAFSYSVFFSPFVSSIAAYSRQ